MTARHETSQGSNKHEIYFIGRDQCVANLLGTVTFHGSSVLKPETILLVYFFVRYDHASHSQGGAFFNRTQLLDR